MALSKPQVIGIYGLPGCGKTTLKRKLETLLGNDAYAFYEGSIIIDSLVEGGLKAFKASNHEEQQFYRELAIKQIAGECEVHEKVAIVVGHLMFWDDEEADEGVSVFTLADMATYTGILYLNVDAETIWQQRIEDSRQRPVVTKAHLHKWQKHELNSLRGLCLANRIIFSTLDRDNATYIDQARIFVEHFKPHTADDNLVRARQRLDKIVEIWSPIKQDAVLVIDGDKTLTADDTGDMFWAEASCHEETMQYSYEAEPTVSQVFNSPMGYSYNAFRQVAFIYQKMGKGLFDSICRTVMRRVKIRPQFKELLQWVEQQDNVSAIVVTCGLEDIWNGVMAHPGLRNAPLVMGNGRITGTPIITSEIKSVLVDHLQTKHDVRVCAFGDSPLDLPMLHRANEAIVVVGDEASRSKSMDKALARAIEQESLRARQVLFNTSKSRLDTSRLPQISLDKLDILGEMSDHIKVTHATDRPAAKLLTTPTRNSKTSALELREAHRRVGMYLAIDVLPSVIGLETLSITHVQAGKSAKGHCLKDEAKTLIIALMRGGEPMAFGVNEVFPSAMFLHAKYPKDLVPELVKEASTILLVDSVVNSGKSVADFAEAIRELNAEARIIVVANVVHADAVKRGQPLDQANARVGQVEVVALRLSENKYTGTGSTDTGNCLFNTMMLE